VYNTIDDEEDDNDDYIHDGDACMYVSIYVLLDKIIDYL
jgi:hypothetical protein